MIRRLTTAAGIGSATIVVTTIAQLIAVPICLTAWGAQRYGEWVALSSLAASLSVLNLGIQSYAGNRLIEFRVRKDIVGGTRILHSVLRAYVLLCGSALVALVWMVCWPGLPDRLGIVSLSGFEGRMVLGAQGLVAAYAIVGGLLMGLFRVVERLPRQLAYGLAERLCITGAPAVVAITGGSVVGASIATAGSLAMIAVVAIPDAVRRSPFPLGVTAGVWSDVPPLLAHSLVFFGIALSASLLSNVLTIMISGSSGAIVVSLFSTTLVMTNAARMLLQQFLTVLWPEITAAAAAGEQQRIAVWHRTALKLAWTGMLSIGTVVTLFGPQILVWWTRGRVAPDPVLNVLLVAYLLIQTPALVVSAFALAAGRQKQLVVIHVTAVATTCLGAVWLISVWGARGAAAALIAGQVLGTGLTLARLEALVPSAALRVSELAGAFIPLLVALICVGALSWWSVSPVARVALGAGVCVTVVLAAWRTWFTCGERDQLFHAFGCSLPSTRSLVASAQASS